MKCSNLLRNVYEFYFILFYWNYIIDVTIYKFLNSKNKQLILAKIQNKILMLYHLLVNKTGISFKNKLQTGKKNVKRKILERKMRK